LGQNGKKKELVSRQNSSCKTIFQGKRGGGIFTKGWEEKEENRKDYRRSYELEKDFPSPAEKKVGKEKEERESVDLIQGFVEKIGQEKILERKKKGFGSGRNRTKKMKKLIKSARKTYGGKKERKNRRGKRIMA